MAVVSFTRALMVAEVRRQLQQKVGGAFDSTDFNRWFDLAIADVVARTRCIRAEATAASVSAQQAYALPTNCLGGWAVSRVRYKNVILQHESWATIEDMIESGLALSSSGTPVYWSGQGRTIRLTPVPNAASDEIEMWYAKATEACSADSVALSNLEIPSIYAPAVETFMRHRGLMLGGEEGKALQAWQLYERQLGIESQKDVDDVATDVAQGAT